MATVAAIVGTELPEDAGEDSYNILPVLPGNATSGPIREATVHHTASGRFAIRRASGCSSIRPRATITANPTGSSQSAGQHAHDKPGELFDLSHDISEHHNLYAKNPAEVQRLKALLEKYRSEKRSAPAGS